MANTKALVHKVAQRIAKRSRVVVVGPDSNLPLCEIGYSQSRELSSYRNHYHLAYKALHTLNLLHQRPVSWIDVADLLAQSTKAGGYAFFAQRSTIKRYLFANKYNLWRKLDRTQLIDGHVRALFVASGITATGQKRADYSRHSGAKLLAITVW